MDPFDNAVNRAEAFSKKIKVLAKKEKITSLEHVISVVVQYKATCQQWPQEVKEIENLFAMNNLKDGT